MGIIGIAFPFQRGTTSFPMMRSEDDVIADNIRRILLTRRGERVMRPTAGAGIWDFIFDSVGSVLTARVDHEVRKAIAEGEPRARVLAVDVYERWQQGGQALIVNVVWDRNEQLQQTAVVYTGGPTG
jgi:phage baseplate assembly protein W